MVKGFYHFIKSKVINSGLKKRYIKGNIVQGKHMTLKFSKMISLYVRKEMLKEIDEFFHKYKMKNRNQAILEILRKGLEAVKSDDYIGPPQ